MVVDGNEVDPITPVSIEHSVDELWVDEQRQELEQYYNYLDYHFERDGHYCRARLYLDEPRSVTLYGPLAGRGQIIFVSDDQLETDVIAYLRRRFSDVRTFPRFDLGEPLDDPGEPPAND
jgi:hypothetical protein